MPVEKTEFYDMDSTYDPAFDVPDLSDTEGDHLRDFHAEELVSQWRHENQQLAPNTRCEGLCQLFAGCCLLFVCMI